jgi:hypothetical protein
MTDATDLWSAVVVSYDDQTLQELTNINNVSATTVNTTAGQDAAQSVLNWWEIHSQIAYDGTNLTHVEVAKEGVIAVLYKRGGTSSTIEEVKWDDVFGADGLISKVKNTGPRGRQGPVSNSGVRTSPETVDGSQVKGWSDRDSSGADFMTARRETAD